MKKSRFKSQQGLSLTGLIVGAFILVFLSITAFKVIPAYIAHAEINKVLNEIATDPEMKKATVGDVRMSFNRRASIDNITAIKAEDIEIDSDRGKLLLTAKYFVKIPLAGNISLYIDFTCASD
ncbi:MAG: DUF4845 domain-containing protein [Gallionella sp.]